MNVYFSSKFIKKAKILTKNNKDLKKSLEKQISVFKSNPRHPSLKFHKLKGKRLNQMAIWIKGDLRALCIKDKDEYLFTNLITHDEY